MPCVSPDGKPTDSGMNMLGAVRDGNQTPEDMAAATGMPMYRVRSGVRELLEAGLLVQSDEAVSLSEQGRSLL
ncbi:MAG: hypothetical protein ACOC9B_03055 [Chloroflexota bacterium]